MRPGTTFALLALLLLLFGAASVLAWQLMGA